MPKPPNIDRPREVHLTLPESVYGKLSLHLWSDLENRIPLGAWQRFFVARINEYFYATRLDLTPFGIEGSVMGVPEVLDALRTRLLSDTLTKETLA